MNSDSDYKIIAKPSLTYVILGKKMSFELVKVNPNAPDPDKLEIHWKCLNNTTEIKENCEVIKFSIKGPKWEDAEWTVLGSHIIVCTVKQAPSLQDKNYTYVQHVITADECVSYNPGSYEETNNPFYILDNAKKAMEQTERLEEKSKLSKEEQEKYEERKSQGLTYCEKLEYLLGQIPESHKEKFYPIRAEHYSKIYPLNSISLCVCYFYANNKVYLLDWTNPVTQGYCGVFEGEGDIFEMAMEEAVNNWKNENRYPQGRLSAIVYHEAVIIHQTVDDATKDPFIHKFIQPFIFDTSGSTFLDDISKAFVWIGIGLMVAIGAIFLFVPMGPAVTTVLWSLSSATAFAMSASAVINITQRYKTGFSNLREDGLDSLTIVTSIISVGTTSAIAKWGSWSYLNATGQMVKANTVKVLLIGQITGDVAQGIAVTADVWLEFQHVFNDESLPPDTKLSKLVYIIAKGSVDGALTYFCVKADTNALTSNLSNLIPNNPTGNTVSVIDKSKKVDANTNTISVGVPVDTPKWLEINQKMLQVGKDRVINGVPNKSSNDGALGEALKKQHPTDYSNNTNETTTRVHSGVGKKVEDDPVKKLREKVVNSGKTTGDFKREKAQSVAFCDAVGISQNDAEIFGNLKFEYEDAASLFEKIGVWGNNSVGYRISEANIEKYIVLLESKYPKQKMHDLTKKSIRKYMLEHKDYLNNIHGMPGAHAEVVAADDLFRKLDEKPGGVEGNLKNITIVTLKTNRPKKDDFLSPFTACTNCSNILSNQIQIITGRE